jgi:hypothetical protein
LSEVFESYKDVKYALLIFEAEKSFLARKVLLNKIIVYELLEFIKFLKLMLDFEPFAHKFPIVRVTCMKNPMFCRDLKVSDFSTDVFPFLVTNRHGVNNNIEVFQDKIDKLQREKIHNISK